MRLPIVPLIIASALLTAVWYLFTSTRPNHKVIDVPRLTRLADASSQDEKRLVEADHPPDVTVDRPRFSPDSLEICFIKTELGVRGDVWVVYVSSGIARPLVSDRAAENPIDVGWINEGRDLA